MVQHRGSVFNVGMLSADSQVYEV